MTKLAIKAGIPAKWIHVCTAKDLEAATELETHPLISKISFTGSNECGEGWPSFLLAR